MTNKNTEAGKAPTPDPAEDNAFFPSSYSLEKYTSSKSDLEGADYPNPYREGKWKVLMIASDERYLLMRNGTMFSTGNHPVEMLLPMYHMTKAVRFRQRKVCRFFIAGFLVVYAALHGLICSLRLLPLSSISS